jgi:hypothetical protein
MTTKSMAKWPFGWPRRTGQAAAPDNSGFALVRRVTQLDDLARVERHLPDILGRAMARAWIDPAFSTALMQDPKALLSRYDVHLPVHVTLQVEMTETGRQRIVVYDTSVAGPPRRVMYLQLVMLAGQ